MWKVKIQEILTLTITIENIQAKVYWKKIKEDFYINKKKRDFRVFIIKRVFTK